MLTRVAAAGVIPAVLLGGMARAAKGEAPLDRTVLPLSPAPYTNPASISYRDSAPQIHSLPGAPAGAPNILVILLDDAGYAQTSTFGALIPTPTLDRLAEGGLRYTRFHVAALCSPSRAALLTGRNHHSVGMGTITELGTGYPGYDGNIPRSAAFVSEILRQNGYSTAAFGKWHLLPNWEMSPTGPFDHWPTNEGFDYYYGFLGGSTDQWNPELYENTLPTVMRAPPGRKADYTLNEALADKAITWIRREKSVTPDRPFFVYYAPGATHAPIQAPRAWIEEFRGKFDMGWDRYREIVFERQKRLGVIPPDAKLTPRPAEFPAWDFLSADQKRIAARLMEVFAGFTAQTDHEIGRVVDAIAETGQLDNTLILYIAGDNGASLERLAGDAPGTFNLIAAENGVRESVPDILNRLDELGSASSSPHYPAPWGWACDTPFQWGKGMASDLGGTRDPLVVYWPGRIKDAGGIRGQFHHLIDVAPTLLEAARVPEPTSVDGVRQKPIEGVSMAYSFDSASAPDRRTTQYFEMFANRAIYHDGWIASARSGRFPWVARGDPDFEKMPWELYHIGDDSSEANDLAAAYPGKLRRMQNLFLEEARKYRVLPMDPRFSERASPRLRPSLLGRHSVFTYYASLHLHDSLAPPVRNRSYAISAEIIVPKTGSDGTIVAEGGDLGGYALFVKDGRVQYLYNFTGRETTTLVSSEKLPPGPVTIDFRFKYDGRGAGKGGTATLSVNGKNTAEGRIPRTMSVIFSFNKTLDIGEDADTPVGDDASPYHFQGEIRKVTFDLAPSDLTPPQEAALSEAERAAAEING